MYKEKIYSFKVKHPSYANDIDNLEKYYRDELKSELPNENVLGGIRTKHILSSIKWLTENKTFCSKATASKYENAVVSLFRELIDGGLENSDLQDQYNMESKKKDSYFFQCNNFINNSDALSATRVLDALSQEQAEYLISECDLAVDNYKYLGNRSKKEAFNNMAAALMVKLILLLGITYSDIYQIPISAYSESNSSLNIKGFSINLPRTYSQQLNLYIKASENFKNDKLFIRYGGQFLTDKTCSTGITYFLKKRISSTSVNALVKYAILQLIKCEISESVIRQFTGAEKDIMLYCFKAAFENVDCSLYINEKLSNAEFYKKH